MKNVMELRDTDREIKKTDLEKEKLQNFEERI